MKRCVPFLLLLLLICSGRPVRAADPVVVYGNSRDIVSPGMRISLLEDKGDSLTVREVLASDDFQPVSQDVLNLGLSASSFWIRFTVANRSDSDQLLLQLGQPALALSVLYTLEPDGNLTISRQGSYAPFHTRKHKFPTLLFDLNIPPGQQRTFLLHVKSDQQLTLPLTIGDTRRLYESLNKKDIVMGCIFGILLSMFFYNLFLYISVRDITYIYYAAYILLITLSQASLQGYAFKYAWPGSSWMAQHSVFIFPSLASIAAMLFSRIFLHTRQYAPRLDRILLGLIGLFALSVLMVFLKLYQLSFAVMQIATLITSLFILYMAVVILKKGYHPAKYFLLAWSALLVSATCLVLRDYGVLDANGFTNNSMVFGCAIEAVLLSFALADKINLLRKEKEASQAQAMTALAEIARIGREQNVILETKVTERTQELKRSNEELNKALLELKEAESQLVESEKMASLGQLTAGIAHEINNPTNFIASNVSPLKRDIDQILELMGRIQEIAASANSPEEKQAAIAAAKEACDYDYLKTEVEFLLKGIKEGSSRTTEIVKELRNFSRLDENDLKKVSVNDGIESTLLIVNHMLNDQITIVKNYIHSPVVECYPGKLNQVFLNIITNSLQAIQAKFDNRPGGRLTITTRATD